MAQQPLALLAYSAEVHVGGLVPFHPQGAQRSLKAPTVPFRTLRSAQVQTGQVS